MGKFFSIGRVIQGDFEGKYVARWTEKEWGIAPAAVFETSKIFGGLRYTGGKWEGPSGDEIISAQTVDHYVELGQQRTGANVEAVVKGTLLFGPIGGMIANAATANNSIADVAFYMKSGKKFVVHFTSGEGWQYLKAALFVL